jgi:hypothetical protein
MKPMLSGKKKSKSNGMSLSLSRGAGSSTASRKASPRFALCVRNDDYPAALERCKVYRVLVDRAAAKDKLLRVIDESGEDYLYPRDFFVTIRVPGSAQKVFGKGVPKKAK